MIEVEGFSYFSSFLIVINNHDFVPHKLFLYSNLIFYYLILNKNNCKTIFYLSSDSSDKDYKNNNKLKSLILNWINYRNHNINIKRKIYYNQNRERIIGLIDSKKLYSTWIEKGKNSFILICIDQKPAKTKVEKMWLWIHTTKKLQSYQKR